MERWPLALCDGQTVPETSLVESDRVRRGYTGGNTFVLPNPEMRWYYMAQQGNDEVVLSKIFDSNPTVTSCECEVFSDISLLIKMLDAPHCSLSSTRKMKTANHARVSK